MARRYQTLLWWEWAVLGVYASAWLAAALCVMFFTAAVVFYAHSIAAAFLSGVAVVAMAMCNPHRMVVDSPERGRP